MVATEDAFDLGDGDAEARPLAAPLLRCTERCPLSWAGDWRAAHDAPFKARGGTPWGVRRRTPGSFGGLTRDFSQPLLPAAQSSGRGSSSPFSRITAEGAGEGGESDLSDDALDGTVGAALNVGPASEATAYPREHSPDCPSVDDVCNPNDAIDPVGADPGDAEPGASGCTNRGQDGGGGNSGAPNMCVGGSGGQRPLLSSFFPVMARKASISMSLPFAGVTTSAE